MKVVFVYSKLKLVILSENTLCCWLSPDGALVLATVDENEVNGYVSNIMAFMVPKIEQTGAGI